MKYDPSTFITLDMIREEAERILGGSVIVGVIANPDVDEDIAPSRLTLRHGTRQADIAIYPSDLALSMRDFSDRLIKPAIALLKRGL